jgi:hypothetical protein
MRHKTDYAFVIAALAVFVFAAPLVYGDIVVDTLNEPGSQYAWSGITGNDVTAFAYDAADKPASLTGTSLRLTYAGNTSWWGAWQGEYVAPTFDLSAETTIKIWAKADQPGIHITLHLITGAMGSVGSGGSIGSTADLTTQWAQYEIPISSFAVDAWYNSGTGNNTIPVTWTNIQCFQYQVGSASGSPAATVWIDHIEAVGALGVGVATVLPAKGASVGTLPQISVTFSKSVTGVDAGDLTVNGSAAAQVTGSGAGPYIFTGYAAPAAGTANVVLASGGIVAGADVFPGDNWTYAIEDWMLATAPLAVVPVTLDGILNPAEWADGNSYYFDGTDQVRPGWIEGTVIPASDFSCTFTVKHDANFVYVGIRIYDDILIEDGPDSPDWRDDRMEMYFDTDNSNTANITPPLDGPGGFQMSYDARNYGGAYFAGFNSWWWARASSDSLHVMTYEFKIAKVLTSGTLTVTMVTGGTYGFDLSPDDADTAGTVRDHQIWWNSMTGNAWNNETTWGDIYLSPNPKVLPVPDVPLGVVATPSSGSVRIGWYESNYASEYRVKRGQTPGGPYPQVTTTTARTKLVTGLTNGLTYYFVVTAANATGESAPSSQVQATPQAGISLGSRKWHLFE